MDYYINQGGNQEPQGHDISLDGFEGTEKLKKKTKGKWQEERKSK